jgi:hypothetical protein
VQLRGCTRRTPAASDASDAADADSRDTDTDTDTDTDVDADADADAVLLRRRFGSVRSATTRCAS